MKMFSKLKKLAFVTVGVSVSGAVTAATIADRLAQYGPTARERLRPYFQKQNLTYPPSQIALIGLKEEKILEVYARNGTNDFKRIRSYPILAASGGAGPKLREGDRQVPEGIYGIESLNPNSRFHLSLRVDYPNAFDRGQAAREGRTNPGGDIMIHGSAVSVGCLAMGDEASEDLFVLAADTGLKDITVILAPVDFRDAHKTVPASTKLPPWTAGLYEKLRAELKQFPERQKP